MPRPLLAWWIATEVGDEVLYPLLRPLLQPLLRMPNERGVSDLSAAIAQLFAAGEQGVWYDPSDLTTLFQDSAGTVPVTAPGQPVGKMLDISGRANHITFAAGVTLQTVGGLFHLLPNGTTGVGATAAFNATFDKALVCVGVLKSGAAVVQDLITFNAAAAGSFRFSEAADSRENLVSGGTSTVTAQETLAGPSLAVYTALGDIAAPSLALRRNGAANASSATTQGTGNYGNSALRLFSRDGTVNPYSGRFYGGIVRFSSAASNASQIAVVEAWVNNKTGAF